MKLQDIATRPTSRKINKINESRFGFRIDYDQLTVAKARSLNKALAENLTKLKHSFGVHTAEKNPKYMELLMVREGLNRWLDENRPLTESEIAKSGAILAAKDIVDSFQDMLEDISKMQNEQLPALLDTIRDQIGQPQADAFKGTVVPLLTELVGQLQTARETADGAARTLAGEQVAAPMGMPGADAGADAGLGGDEMAGMAAGEVPGGMPPEPTGDEFAATDAATGGDESLGRAKR